MHSDIYVVLYVVLPSKTRTKPNQTEGPAIGPKTKTDLM